MSNEKMSEFEERIEKLKQLEGKSINAYPSSTSRTHTITEVLGDFDNLIKQKTKLVIVGRLRSKRTHGNLTFSNVQDGGAKIQVAFSKKEIGVDKYKEFVKLVDMGDFVEISGECFVTHKGEQSVMVSDWRILSKALRPLPEKWHGIKGEEDRYRKRYLDLLINDDLRDMFVKKSKFWDVTRNFLKDKGFFEVETPTLETTTGGAEASPFKTFHNDYNLPVFLRISVGELWQKRLMAAGFEKTFEIGRVYRNEGSSPNHLQEFTNMEFYWAYADYRDGMKLVQELYLKIAKEVFGTTKFKSKEYEFDLADEWVEIDYAEEIMGKTGVDVLKTSEEEIKAKLEELGVKYEGDNRERLTDTLWKYCRKSIAGPAFLINHPKLISPLAKEVEGRPGVVQRFQPIIGGAEVGNGYSELNDPIDQRRRFEEQQKLLEGGDDEAMMPDWEFVEMLEHGMPPTCGFGFGERLFSFLVDKVIRETTLFPLMKPLESHLTVRPETHLVAQGEKESSLVVQDEKPMVVADVDLPALGIDREGALKLLDENITDEVTKLHMIETEIIMEALAKHLGAEEAKWGVIGLLHDVDWSKTKDNVSEHGTECIEILRGAGASEFLIETITSHVYGNDTIPAYGNLKREGQLQHLLAAAETVTGLIVANTLMQPDKKVASVKLSSLKKKYKNKSFAANCKREIIAECEMAGIPLDEFLEISLEAMKASADKFGM